MKKFILTICFICSVGFGSSYSIFPCKMEGQNELLMQGEKLIISRKQHGVLLYQTDRILKNGDCRFYLACSNNSDTPLNLYFQNLSVTDQWGRPIRVVRKEELIAKKKTKTRWKRFASALCTGLESYNAQSAGDISFKTNTIDNYYLNGSSMGSNGWVNTYGNIYGSSSTNGTIHCEALKRQAMQQVNLQSQARSAMIEDEYQDYEFAIKNNYFDSNTLFPNDLNERIFQISVPKNIENQLEYIFVNLDISGERHTFCFYCANNSKNKRR